MLHDGVIHWFGHGQQASLSVTHVEALREEESEATTKPSENDVSTWKKCPSALTDLDVQLERDRSHVGVEIERSRGAAPKPVCHVFGIGQRRTEGHDADGTLNL